MNNDSRADGVKMLKVLQTNCIGNKGSGQPVFWSERVTLKHVLCQGGDKGNVLAVISHLLNDRWQTGR